MNTARKRVACARHGDGRGRKSDWADELAQRIAAFNESDGAATARRMAQALSGPAAEIEPRPADPHHRLPHAGACVWRVEQGDPAQARRVDQGTEGQGKYRGHTRYVAAAGHAAGAGVAWQDSTVVVTEEGFEYAGKAFASLTKIAHAITGAHWSGPRFFGLIRKSASNGQLGSDASRSRSTRRSRSMANRSAPGSQSHPGKTPLRDLYPQEQRGRAGTGLQLARRPARGLRGLHRQPEARRVVT